MQRDIGEKSRFFHTPFQVPRYNSAGKGCEYIHSGFFTTIARFLACQVSYVDFANECWLRAEARYRLEVGRYIENIVIADIDISVSVSYRYFRV